MREPATCTCGRGVRPIPVLERELELERRARELAEHQIERRDALLTFVAHELRSPLASISGWLEFLMTASDDHARRRAGHVLGRNVKTLARLVDELVDHARVASNAISLELQDVDLATLVHAASDETEANAASKRLHFSCDLERAAGTLRGDGFRLHQLLVNLLANAIKFTPSGGHVEFKAVTGEASVELTVRDDGPGIAREHLRAIFEPFVRVGGGARSGLGLGLNIARIVTELHGGTLAAESDGPGTGSTFRLTLPLATR